MTDQELPEAPMIVLAKLPLWERPAWMYWIPFNEVFSEMGMLTVMARPCDLTVIPHPRNDPRAVELIQAARKGEGE